jgi:hypothetical protein
MPNIRIAWRSAAALGVVAVGIPALGTLLATPADAFGFHFFHLGPTMPAAVRPPAMHSFAAPANQSIVSHVRPHIASTPSTGIAVSRSAPSRSLTVKSSPVKILRTQLPVVKNTGSTNKKPEELRIPAPIQVNAGGPSAPGVGSMAPINVPGGSGGSGQGGGNATFPDLSGLGSAGDNGSSGQASPSAGGGSGQYTTASVPPNRSTRARTSDGATATRRPPVGGSATTPTTTGAMTLTAVTACVTPVGACAIERDVGTACQCKDTLGRVYDGIVR